MFRMSIIRELALLVATLRPWHDVLGVTPSASIAEIKAASLRLAKQHHPDASGDAEQFHQIQRAYDQAVAS
jgi:curved DNA-binding protein CbpA